MKILVVVFCVCLLGGCSHSGEQSKPEAFLSGKKMSVANAKILLDTMQENDQQYRDSLRSRPPGREQFYMQKIAESDQANLKILDQIVQQFGWPGKKAFGEDGAETAWLIIWHQRDKRSILCKYYDQMEAAVQKGEMNANAFKKIEEAIAKISPDQIEY